MKIITNDAVYVQKDDIIHLYQSDLFIPESVFMKFFDGESVVINDSNRYDFVKFEEKPEMEFFQNIDWMIDYNEVKDLNEDEFISVGQKIARDKNELAQIINSMPKSEKQRYMATVNKYELLEHKLYSLRNVLWFKQGHIFIRLPEGIDYPDVYKKEKGIKRILKTIFKK